VIVGRPLIRLAETGSTMDLASELASHGALSGTTVLAGHQTAGRGRADRTWATEPGSAILMSFVAHTQRRQRELGPLSLLLGLAVSRTVDDSTGAQSTIKWPNDVLVEGQKIAGILIVSKMLRHRDGLCLIAGVGLNVNDDETQLPMTATSLAMVAGTSQSFDDAFSRLLRNLSLVMGQFEAGDFGALWHEVGQRLAFRNETVRIEDGARMCEGRLRGVTEGGLLELELPTGATITVAAGDLTRGPVTIA